MLASLTTFVTAMALTASAPTAPQWESDYGKALAQTRTDSRPLLIVLDKPGDAKQQIDSVLLNDTKADAPLAKYDLCHVDVSTEYGRAVAKVFHASEFPYYAIIDKSGSTVLHRHAGKVTAETWKATLTKHMAGERAVRVTVAKPVINESAVASESATAAQPVTIQAEPITFGNGYYESSTPSYYATPVKPYCPSCQRNNR